MKVKIIRGIYGHRENGRVVEKTKDHAPFEIGESEGKRLIKLGVAKKVGDAAEPAEQVEEHAGYESDGINVETEEQGTGHLSRKSLETMKIGELRKLAEDMGLEKTGGREELIDRIVETEVSYDDDEEDEDFPDLSPAEPE